MATKEENINEEIGGRRTRSGRKTSSTPTTPARSTRRSSRKQNQETNEFESDMNDDNLKIINEDDQYDAAQSDIIKEMLAEAAQGVIIQDNEEYISTHGDDEQITEEIICETYEDPQEYHFETVTILDDEQEPFTEQITTEQGDIIEEDDVEMVVIQNVDNLENVDDEQQEEHHDIEDHQQHHDHELEDQQHHDHELEDQQQTLTNTIVTSEMMQPIEQMVEDENGSSFPFGGSVQQSENSADNKIEENIEQQTVQMVDSSLLASMAGDNANSLPSAGEESQSKENFEDVTEEIIEEEKEQQQQIKSNDNEYNPDDTRSENAIAEDLPNGSDGNATGPDDNEKTLNNVDADMVSEDELQTPPPTTKPKVNDAEEVSDDELPGPKLAELPADTEVVSEDELPANGSKKDGSKRKAGADEEYNPSSPTGEESNDAAPEKKVKLDAVEEKEESKEKKKEKKKLPDLDKYWKTVKDDPSDFTGWTYLLQYVDQETDVEAAREAYDAFLFHYPYCYGYWRKYADYEKRKGDKEKCYEVFERGLKSIPLSVDLWIHYLSHVKSNSGDNEDYVRSQFNRAVDACGLEFRSDKLWEAFIKWEMESKRYSHIVKIYDKLLGIPTQGYNGHFDSFQDLISNHSASVTISIEEFKKLRNEVRESNEKSTKSKEKHGKDKDSKDRHSKDSKDKDSKDKDSKDKDSKDKDSKDKDLKDKDSKDKESKDKESKDKESKDKDIIVENDKESKDELKSDDTATTTIIPPSETTSMIVDTIEADDHVRNDDEMTAIKDKIISIRRKIHKTTVAAVTARWSFEEGIKRPYFHVKPLERSQLKNWKEYLEFEIEKGDRKRILILFERCLIACALYDEFWLKLIRYLECENATELIDYTRDAYIRACTIHHTDKPSLHLMWSAFEECQNNFDKASEILIKLDEHCPNLLQIAYRRINLERRRGNFDKCKELYEHYIDIAKSKNIAGSLAIKFARFCHKILKDIQLGMDKLKLILEKDSGNTRIALQMIDLALQRDIVDEIEIIEIMDKFVSRDGVDLDQKVLFAQRKVEFLEDFGSSAKALQEAQRYLQIALSKANEAKKKGESSPSHKSSSKDSKLTTATASATANYNSTSGYYGSTAAAAASQQSYYNSSGQQQQQQQQYQQQQQQSYDGYGYNHWQYGSGYSGYGQWGGYGNYY